VVDLRNAREIQELGLKIRGALIVHPNDLRNGSHQIPANNDIIINANINLFIFFPFRTKTRLRLRNRSSCSIIVSDGSVVVCAKRYRRNLIIKCSTNRNTFQ